MIQFFDVVVTAVAEESGWYNSTDTVCDVALRRVRDLGAGRANEIKYIHTTLPGIVILEQ